MSREARDARHGRRCPLARPRWIALGWAGLGWRGLTWAGVIALVGAASLTVGASLTGATSLVEAIAAQLRPAVKTLSRSVYVYHYASRARLELPPAGYVAPNASVLAPFLRTKIRRFWDLDQPVRQLAGERGVHLVSALYAGPDPVRSHGFGGAGDSWVGVQVRLPAGFRFVDVRGLELSPALAARLTAADCRAVTAHYLLLTIESEACRRLAVQILQQLSVGGVLYAFERFPFPLCEDAAPASFVLLDPRLAGTDHAALYTAIADPADAFATDRQRIRELYGRARRAGSRRAVPWPELAPEPVPKAMDDWMRRHLFGCGRFPEDRAE